MVPGQTENNYITCLLNLSTIHNKMYIARLMYNFAEIRSSKFFFILIYTALPVKYDLEGVCTKKVSLSFPLFPR